jgi:hypothetical protein
MDHFWNYDLYSWSWVLLPPPHFFKPFNHERFPPFPLSLRKTLSRGSVNERSSIGIPRTKGNWERRKRKNFLHITHALTMGTHLN